MRVTVAIPCYNEAPTIAKVVRDFQAQLPQADILVVDNASTDGSGAMAREAGARVVREKRQGKGFVMQTILEEVDGDVCVIVDGDDTYFAEDVHGLMGPIAREEADMVVGDRLRDASSAALNDLHRFGNRAILAIVNFVFRTRYRDVLSGYRILNRRFMERVPLITGGFETETELTLQGLERGMAIVELPIRYRARPAGSFSKLSPFADGYRILITIGTLLKNHRPLLFFSGLGLLLLVLDLVVAAVWASRVPEAPDGMAYWAFVAAGALLAALLPLFGILISAITTGVEEMTALSRRGVTRRSSTSTPRES